MTVYIAENSCLVDKGIVALFAEPNALRIICKDKELDNNLNLFGLVRSWHEG